MLLPELSERDARGEKAGIYAEMKELGAVPMVALIFRHLATLPGGLEWTWAAIGPAWRSGRLQEAACRPAEKYQPHQMAVHRMSLLIHERRLGNRRERIDFRYASFLNRSFGSAIGREWAILGLMLRSNLRTIRPGCRSFGAPRPLL